MDLGVHIKTIAVPSCSLEGCFQLGTQGLCLLSQIPQERQRQRSLGRVPGLLQPRWYRGSLGSSQVSEGWMGCCSEHIARAAHPCMAPFAGRRLAPPTPQYSPVLLSPSLPGRPGHRLSSSGAGDFINLLDISPHILIEVG